MGAREEEFSRAARDLIEPLRRYLARRTDPATADDVLSETLLVCWRRWDEVPAEPLPWAYAVARNQLANARRSARRQERVAARLRDQPTAGSGETGRDDVLHEALAGLSDQEQELVRLWAWEQLGPGEIATVLDITSNAASLRLLRAREKLKESIGKIEAAGGHEPAEGGRG